VLDLKTEGWVMLGEEKNIVNSNNCMDVPRRDPLARENGFLSRHLVFLMLTHGTMIACATAEPGNTEYRDTMGQSTEDRCPDDPAKTEPGECGCGYSDSDGDDDGVPDCDDVCPTDEKKTDLGECGCGVEDQDSDGDGVFDCNDYCPMDPEKTEAGNCGCGISDADGDGDGVPDCDDDCPADPQRTEPGECGCDAAGPDEDSDGDGVFDCDDDCPTDPEKREPGECGCGEEEIVSDSDSDGVLDCMDNCPTDPGKTEPGVCGCGAADTDSDSDGVLDCIDICPEDPHKTTAGICGCGIPESDSDSDGTLDCNDECPNDPNKTDPGSCGCGVAEDCETPIVPIVVDQLGRTLTISEVYLNGGLRTRVVVPPGSSVSLRVVGDVVDSNTSCGSCITQFYARLNGVYSLCLGSSTSNWNFDKSGSFTAPTTPGEYYINPSSSWQYSCETTTSTSVEFGVGTIGVIVVQ